MTQRDAPDQRLSPSPAETLPEGRRKVVQTALEELLAMAAELERLPLEGVEPVCAPPRWQ
jgi:hypothetical protein